VADFVAAGGLAENAICGSEYNTSRIAQEPRGNKEALVCAEFAERFWKNSDGTVNFNENSDRWDWCGLNLPQSLTELIYAGSPQDDNQVLIRQTTSEFIS
jgi:hypothetical protein